MLKCYHCLGYCSQGRESRPDLTPKDAVAAATEPETMPTDEHYLRRPDV